jgi:16S rRNA (uracil1498-N3)-methyltransferase
VPKDGRVRIEGAVAAQMRKVLRLGPGDRVVLFGADEWEYTVCLEWVEREVALGTVVSRAVPLAEPRFELTLAMALLKSEKTEWVLQKGTELGVRRFLLLQTQRTVAAPDERRAAGRRERYRRIILEATEQCGRVRPPGVEGPIPLQQALSGLPDAPAFLLQEGASERLSHLLRGVPAFRRSGVQAFGAQNDEPGYDAAGPHGLNARLTLMIGPEGGFSEEEVSLATARGVRTASLGARVLRAETAALAAAALAVDILDRALEQRPRT